MNTQENNKLIAEFMGVFDKILSTNNIHSWSDAPYFYTTENSKEKVEENIAKYAKYSTSWDWLMPVVKKCREESNAEDSHWESVYYSLEGCDIDVTYQSVVNFIKWL